MAQRKSGQRRPREDGISPTTARSGRTVPIKWEGIEESPLIFSNNLLVQHTDHEFIITFAQIHPPIALPGQEAELEKIKFVSARAAVRIVLTPTRFKELMQILATNYQSFLKRMAALEQEQTGGEEGA